MRPEAWLRKTRQWMARQRRYNRQHPVTHTFGEAPLLTLDEFNAQGQRVEYPITTYTLEDADEKTTLVTVLDNRFSTDGLRNP